MNEEYTFDLSREMQVYGEAYFGKTKEFKQMEECIQNLKDEYQDSLLHLGNIENNSNWQKLRKLLEDKFGFYSLSLILKRDSLPNACTYPVSCTIDGAAQMSKYAVVDKGLKYNKNCKCCTLVYVTDTLFFNEKLTSAEVLSVLLHEIGHNFDEVCYKHLCAFNVIDSIFYAVFVLINNPLHFYEAFLMFTGGRRIYSQFMNSIQGCMLWVFFDFIGNLVSIPVGIAYKIFLPIIKPILYGISTVYNIIDPLTPFILACDGYQKEQFADKFVAVHGYGPEYASAMGKLEDEINNLGITWGINRVPIIAHFYQALAVATSFLGKSRLDPHPDYAARMMAIMNVIETDLDKDKSIDAKTKQQAKKDIARIRQNVKDYLDDAKDENSFGDDVQKAYQRWLLNMYPGKGDIRSSLYPDNDQKINQALEEIRKRKNKSTYNEW